MADKTHAVGQLQGYLLQVRHMLYELTSLDDIVVSIEELDDVAVKLSDGSVVAEQFKSVTSDNNPITNRSCVFWKTLYNWFNYIHSGSLTLDKTVFRMVVVSNHSLQIGKVVNRFNDASTIKNAKEALRAVKLELWGENDILRASVPPSYGEYLDVLFADGNEDLVSQLIVKFKLDIHDNDYDEKLTNKFNALAGEPKFQEELFHFMLGWVNNRVNESTKQGASATISSVDFRNALTAQRRMYDQKECIPALSDKVTYDDVQAEIENRDIYIQQLDLIEMNTDGKFEAASDYLQTKAEVIKRADKGIFTVQSFDDYNNKIYRIWKSKLVQLLFSHSFSDVEKGMQLYAKMGEAVIDIELQGSKLPCFFGSGTLQTLANQPREEPTIGWHPKYKELLKGDKQNG